jgi:hypothetical protein
MAARTVHNRPSILVSELYAKGAPIRDVLVERVLPTVEGRLKAILVPGEHEVTTVVIWPPGSDTPDRIERRAQVEWQAWRFNSRRPWVCCSWCSRRCSRLFLATGALAGSLLCIKCAGDRYLSQNLTPLERLQARREEIVEELGSEPTTFDKRYRYFVPRPKGMHLRRFFLLINELEAIEEELERLRQEQTAEIVERAYRNALAIAAKAEKMGRRNKRG